MTKRMTIVEVFDWDDADSDSLRPPTNLIAFKDWLHEQIKAIPKEYQKSAQIDIHGYPEIYDNIGTSIRITYERLETDDEESCRIKKDEKYKKQIEEQRRKHNLY